MAQHKASMKHERAAGISFRWRLLAAACVLLSCFAGAKGQVSPTGQKQMGEPADDKLPSILHGVDIQQHQIGRAHV